MDSNVGLTTASALVPGAIAVAGVKRPREEGPQEAAGCIGGTFPQDQRPTTFSSADDGHEGGILAGIAKRPCHPSPEIVETSQAAGQAARSLSPPPSPCPANVELTTTAGAAETTAAGDAVAAESVPVRVTSISPARPSAAVVVPAAAAARPPSLAPASSPLRSPPSQAASGAAALAAAAAIASSPSCGGVTGPDPSSGLAGNTVAKPVGDLAGAATGGAGAGNAGVAGDAAATVVKETVEMCQVCHKQERRYCCPRCGKLTCSLPCCVRHKKEEGCNGQRDKVAFVGLKEFTDVHLRSDFNFLEDALRCVDGGRRALARRPGVLGNPRQQRNPSGRGGRGRGRGRGRQQQRGGGGGGGGDDGDQVGDGAGDVDQEREGPGDGGALGLLSARGQGWLAGRTPKLQRLVKEAAIRGTRLLLMPDGMARRDGNSTTVAGAPGRGRRFSGRGRGTRGRGRGGGRGGGGRGSAGGGGGVSASGGGVSGGGVNVVGGGGGGDAVGTKEGAPTAGAAGAQAVGGTGASNIDVRGLAAPPGSTATASAAKSSSDEKAFKPPGMTSTSSASQELLEVERRLSAGVGGGAGGCNGKGGHSDVSNGSKVSRSVGAGASSGPVLTAAVVTPAKTTVLWKVEWVFCSAVAGGGSSSGGGGGSNATAAGADKSGDVTVSDLSVSEELSLFEALAKHLEPRPGNAPLRHRLKRFSKPFSNDVASSGRGPGASGATATAAGGRCGETGTASGTGTGTSVLSVSGVSPAAEGSGVTAQQQQGRRQRRLRFFLQRVPCTAKAPLYWEIEGGERLGAALKGKTVIEYPTVYVTLRDDQGNPAARRFRTLVSDVDDLAPGTAAAAASNGSSGDPAALILGEVEKALAPPPPPPPSLELHEQGVLSGANEVSVPGQGEGAAPMELASEEEEEDEGSDSESESSSESESDDDSDSDSSSEDSDKGIPLRPSHL